jgi:hypothetical protein
MTPLTDKISVPDHTTPAQRFVLAKLAAGKPVSAEDLEMAGIASITTVPPAQRRHLFK